MPSENDQTDTNDQNDSNQKHGENNENENEERSVDRLEKKKKKPGRPSSFTPAQVDFIESYGPAFDAEVHLNDPTFRGKRKAIGTWKENTAKEILLSPLFDGQLDMELHDENWWRDVSSYYHSCTPLHPAFLLSVSRL